MPGVQPDRGERPERPPKGGGMTPAQHEAKLLTDIRVAFIHLREATSTTTNAYEIFLLEEAFDHQLGILVAEALHGLFAENKLKVAARAKGFGADEVGEGGAPPPARPA